MQSIWVRFKLLIRISRIASEVLDQAGQVLMAWCEAFLNKDVLSTEYSLDYGLSAGGLYQCHIFTWRPKTFAAGVDDLEHRRLCAWIHACSSMRLSSAKVIVAIDFASFDQDDDRRWSSEENYARDWWQLCQWRGILQGHPEIRRCRSSWAGTSSAEHILWLNYFEKVTQRVLAAASLSLNIIRVNDRSLNLSLPFFACSGTGSLHSFLSTYLHYMITLYQHLLNTSWAPLLLKRQIGTVDFFAKVKLKFVSCGHETFWKLIIKKVGF